METQSQRRRKVLYDLPATEDKFSGGGHRRTAASLANTIIEFDDQARSIGLEGKWGSGKSTIVEIAKKVLDEAPGGREYYVFTFDLWTNQNTNFRRSFLESLLSWLLRIDDSQKTFVEEMRDKIRDRTVDTRTTSTKVFTKFGLVALVFIIALPLLYMWTSPAAFKEGQPISQLTSFAWLAFGLIALITLIATISFKGREANGARPSWEEAFSHTLSVFSKDAQTVQIKQNIREADPTQNEFETTLKKILASFQTKSRRIIIVFDNIDRLSSERIVDAWSDIRSVLSSSDFNDEAAKKITAIVPYDKNHILRALQFQEDVGSIEQDDVFRKSFHAIFFVSPPVISDAVDFFYDKLKEALGEAFESNSAYGVYKIFEISRAGETATPRQVISFINSITGLWEQWGDLIPLPTIAVFVVHRDKIEEDPGILRAEESIDPRYRELSNDNEVFKNLAALAFNVEPEFAYQILLNSRIEQIFTSDDLEAAREVAKSPGFGVIAPEVYAEGASRWATSSPTQFKNAAKNLTVLDMTQVSSLHCKRKIIEAIKGLKDVNPQEWEKFYDLTSVLDICTTTEAYELTSAINAWLHRSLPDAEDERTFIQGQQWIGFFGKVNSRLTETISDEEAKNVLSQVAIPAGSEFLLGAGYEAGAVGLSIRLFNAGKNKINAKSLDLRIVQAPDEIFYAWPEVKHLVNSQAVPTLLEKLASDLGSEPHLNDVERLSYLVSCFNMLYEDGGKGADVVAMRKNLISIGSLYHHIDGMKEADGEDAARARAAELWLVVDYFRAKGIPDGELSHATFGDITEAKRYVQEVVRSGLEDEETIDNLVDQTAKFDRFPAWVSAAATKPDHTGLLQQIIRRGVVSGKFNAISATALISNYDFLKMLLGEDIESLLRVVGESAKPDDFAEIDPSTIPVQFVPDVFPRKEAGWGAFLAQIETWLRAIEPTEWAEELRSRGKAYQLLVARIRLGDFTLHPSSIRAPIVENVLSMLSGDIAAFPGMDDAVEALPRNSRNGLANDIVDRLERVAVTTDGFSHALVSYPNLLMSLPLASNPEAVVRKILLPAVQTQSENGVEFIERVGSQFRTALKSAPESLVGEIQEFLGVENRDKKDSIVSQGQRIRQILDLPALEAPTEEVGDAEEGDVKAPDTSA